MNVLNWVCIQFEQKKSNRDWTRELVFYMFNVNAQTNVESDKNFNSNLALILHVQIWLELILSWIIFCLKDWAINKQTIRIFLLTWGINKNLCVRIVYLL